MTTNMSKGDDPRVQEALRLLAEVADEVKHDDTLGEGRWIGWHITEGRRPNYNFVVEITPK